MTGDHEPDAAQLPGDPQDPVADFVAAYEREREARETSLFEKAGVSSWDELVERAAEAQREQAMPAPTWQDLEEALTSLGSETHIARRLEVLRGMRGLSQEQLAAKLAALGVQMPQSSISKIEVPVKTGKGKRRDITVDEALALAKALEVPLTFLMLPDGSLDDLKLHRIYASGGELASHRDRALADYEYAVRQVADAARTRQEWRQRVENELEEARRVVNVTTVWRRPFLEDVLRQLAEDEQKDGEQP